MYLLLIRHPESCKNTDEIFSTAEGKESLTEKGKLQILSLSESLAEFINKKQLKIRQIYSSNSARSNEPASILGDKLNANIRIYKELRSTFAGSLAGISLKDAEKIEPNFVKHYKLYRAGLYSSYNIETLDGRETRQSLEKRVQDCIKKIINESNENIKIVLMHRSSITATLIYFARKFYRYPKDFYGYVSLDVGNISCLERIGNQIWEIKAVNISPIELQNIR